VTLFEKEGKKGAKIQIFRGVSKKKNIACFSEIMRIVFNYK